MKRLVVCCDGTWQKLVSPYPTNVVKIAQAVKPSGSDGIPQIVFYDEGVGTESRLRRFSGGAFGKGIDENIQDAYRFLCLNYAPDDEIYLFGFSRGAYTVRSLAGMIYNSGLLSRTHISEAPQAYDLYRDRTIKPHDPAMVEFRDRFKAKQVPITLLGCWDTVGSLGIPNLISFLPFDQQINEKYAFHDTSLSPIIQNALHAVSIDELRKVFDVTPMDKSRKSQSQRLRQIWFSGDHGCVGGGMEQRSGLSDGALQWMMDSIKALGLGLDLDPNAIERGIKPDYLIDFSTEPTTFFGRLTRLTGTKIREISGTFDDIHETVKRRWKHREDYRPKNLLEKFGDSLDQFVEDVIKDVQEGIQDVQEGKKDVTEGIKDVAQDVAADVKDAAKDIAADVKNSNPLT